MSAEDEKPKENAPEAEPTAAAEPKAEAEAAAAEAKPPVDEDLASPEAIARRVAALGEEDELERLARIEEQKLAERRAKQKGAGKRGLEAAASKRLAKIGEKKPGTPRGLPPAAQDPLLQKTNELSKWAKQNRSLVAAIIGGVLLVAGGFALKEYLGQRKEAAASEILAEAVADQRGKVGEPNPEAPEGFKDPTPTFKTAAEREDAALAKYREVQSKYPGTGAAYLARLAEGSILLDKRQAEEAAKAYSDVRASPLAAADAEVRGRALEGLGFAYELQAQAGNQAKLDDAIKVFRELENTDVKGFKELGMYHQARVYELKGDKDKAKELLKSVRERAQKPGEGHPFPYLESVAEDRLRALDPTAVPPRPSMAGIGGANAPGNKMSEAQMRKMIEQLQKQMKEAQEKQGQQQGQGK